MEYHIHPPGDVHGQPPGDILDRLRQLLPELRAKYHVAELAVFGSRARADATPRSDLDLLVTFDPGRQGRRGRQWSASCKDKRRRAFTREAGAAAEHW